MAGTIIGIVIAQRLLELIWARSNTKYMKRQGALEIGVSQYKYFILFHCGFFLTLFLEVYWWRGTDDLIYWLPLIIFMIAQGLRIWCISSLGRFWNTRVFVLPGSLPIVKGPYRLIRHPNYLAVVLELAFLPLIFGAWYTAIFFTITNGFLLRWRIKSEEWGLEEIMNYEEEMKDKPRLIPKKIL